MDCYSLSNQTLDVFSAVTNLWICFTGESIAVLLVASVIFEEELFQVTLQFCNSGLQISLKIKTSLLNE